MFRVMFVDDFGHREPDVKVGPFRTKGAAQVIVDFRNEQIFASGLEEYGHWYVSERRARD